MRWRLIVPVLFLAPVALAMPIVGDGDCVPDCAVQVRSPGAVPVFVPPALTIRSGGSVAFSTTDNNYHTASTGPTFLDPCLDVGLWPNSPSVEVTFKIEDGALKVYDPDAMQKRWRTCTAADGVRGDAESGFALPYFCHFHGDQQRGVIMVLPEE